MYESDEGIWVRLTLSNGVEITGFATGAERPNDFWTKFRTQLVRLDKVNSGRPTGEETRYVNRDHIVVVDLVGARE